MPHSHKQSPQPKIKAFFSPARGDKDKRRRSQSSPDINKVEKSQKMAKSEGFDMELLLKLLGDMIDEKLNVHFSVVNAKLENIVEENKQLKEEISILKRGNMELNDKMDTLSARMKSKNLIFWGTSFEKNEDVKFRIIEMCKDILNVTVDVDRVYKIGKKDSSGKPILVEFVKAADIYLVLQNAKKLKNTGIWITRDLTLNQRKGQTHLLKVRRELSSQYKGINIAVRVGYLIFEGKRYIWDPNEENGIQNYKELVDRVMHKYEAAGNIQKTDSR